MIPRLDRYLCYTFYYLIFQWPILLLHPFLWKSMWNVSLTYIINLSVFFLIVYPASLASQCFLLEYCRCLTKSSPRLSPRQSIQCPRPRQGKVNCLALPATTELNSQIISPSHHKTWSCTKKETKSQTLRWNWMVWHSPVHTVTKHLQSRQTWRNTCLFTG